MTLFLCAKIGNRTAARWCAPCEDDFPAIPSCRSRPDKTGDLGGIYTFIRDTHSVAVLFRERQSDGRALSARQYTPIWDIPAGNKTTTGRTHNAQLMLSILAPLHGPTITVTSNQRPQVPILIQFVSSLPFT